MGFTFTNKKPFLNTKGTKATKEEDSQSWILFPFVNFFVSFVFKLFSLYCTSVIARVYPPEAISRTTRGLLRREERPPRNDEFTRICTVENSLSLLAGISR
jgi:hypothetical protein